MSVVVGRCALADVDLVISQGADNRYAFRYTRDGLPVDLTGWVARAQLRKRVGGDVWLTLTNGDGISLNSDGVVVVSIPAAVTESVEWNGYARLVAGKPVPSGVWDLELVDPAGGVVRFVQGTVTVCPDVTR